MRLKAFSAAFPGLGLMTGKVGQFIDKTEQIKSLEFFPDRLVVEQTSFDSTKIGQQRPVTVINLGNAAWYELEHDKPH